MFIQLTDQSGYPIAVDPSTFRTIKPMQYFREDLGSGPQSYVWGAFLTPKRDSHDHIVVRETYEEVMKIIGEAK